MEKEVLSKITHTVGKFEVKNLKWLKTDNIITGLVKDPLAPNPKLNDGFVGAAWRLNGTPTNMIRGRSELKLAMISDGD